MKAFAGYAQFESIEYLSLLQDVSGSKAKKAVSKEVSFLTVDRISILIPDSGIACCLHCCMTAGRVQELCDITIAKVSLGSVSNFV